MLRLYGEITEPSGKETKHTKNLKRHVLASLQSRDNETNERFDAWTSCIQPALTAEQSQKLEDLSELYEEWRRRFEAFSPLPLELDPGFDSEDEDDNFDTFVPPQESPPHGAEEDAAYKTDPHAEAAAAHQARTAEDEAMEKELETVWNAEIEKAYETTPTGGKKRPRKSTRKKQHARRNRRCRTKKRARKK